MKKIEEYINQNREDFEVLFSKKNALWENIEQGISNNQSKEIRVLKWWHLSAAACIIGVVLFMVFQNVNNKSDTASFCSVNGVSKTFCMQINNYETDIQNTLKNMNDNNLDIPEEVKSEVKIDSPTKKILMQELIKNPNNQNIQDAILKYYKAKLELVQRIEEVLKNQENNINNETSTNTVI